MQQKVSIFKIPMSGPGDTAELKKVIEEGQLNPSEIVAILGKTEGNGGVNDFTREYATFAQCSALAPYLVLTPEEVEARIAFVMSGGTEGVLSPHITIFTRTRVEAGPSQGKRLAMGIAATRDFLPEEIGRAAQIEETEKAVREAIADAGISQNEDVHFVQIKCPLLTAERVGKAEARGKSAVTKSSYASMSYSRGASALGVARALGEVKSAIPDGAVCKDWNLYSTVASASSGIELLHNAVIVFGNAAGSLSPYVIGHAVMSDAIDLNSVLSAFASAGLDPLDRGDDNAPRLVNVFAKAEASPAGSIRGFRHTMLDDTDISATRHARAAVGGLIAGVAGDGAIYVSGGAEHQGPSGGGPIAVIASVPGAALPSE